MKKDLFKSTEKQLWQTHIQANPSLHDFAPKHLKLKVPLTLRDKLQAQHPEVELLFMTEEAFDKAIIGVIEHEDVHSGKMVKAVQYDHAKVIEVNMEMGMTEEEALEFFDYNQAGAYVGEQTPIYKYEDYGEDLD